MHEVVIQDEQVLFACVLGITIIAACVLAAGWLIAKFRK